MHRLFLALTTVMVWPAMVAATCSGADLTPTLTEADRAEIAAEIGDAPYARGNHWRATRGDDVLHLIGTIHIGDPRITPALDRLAPVVEAAHTLLLEVTQEGQTALAQTIAANPDMLILPGDSLPERLAEDDWQRLSEAVQARGIPPVMAARMRPWYLSVTLGMPACLDVAEAANAGVDKQLERLALAAGVATRALEPETTVFSVFEALPIDAQLAMLRASILPPQIAEDLLETTIRGYLSQEHARVWAQSEVLSARFTPLNTAETEAAFEAMSEQILEKRNEAWIPVILDAVAQADGAPVVAAFGAAHLSGEKGVLALLEAEGFTLTRQPF